jgi:type II secretory pathway pseudopilin PulG
MTRAAGFGHCPARQGGAALLLMMLVVMIAAMAVLLTRLNQNEQRARQQSDAQDALAMARKALLDYAIVSPDFSSGYAARLPCPDTDNSGGLLEGVAHSGACGAIGTSVMGRLPWRTLGIAPAMDSADSCLWYVVSGSYKDAVGTAAAMLNADTNGQLQLYGIEAGAIVLGQQAEDRAVAMIVAPMPALAGQSREAPVAGNVCSNSTAAADFLDIDALSGISNRALSGAADGVDQLAMASGYNESHNDRVTVITRDDLARAISTRNDFDSSMRALGQAIASCIANYASTNPGGGNDRRLPWPAPLSLADYRDNARYDDLNTGALSGRLPDTSDDSNVLTGNSIARVLSDCDPLAVPAWTTAMQARWQNWKDHFFYAVAESFAPSAPVPSACSSCLSVNGAGQYAAVIVFGNLRLRSQAQLRNAPPVDADTKRDPVNYLESGNAAHFPYLSGSIDLVSAVASPTFNDILFCVDSNLAVTEC